ncbi:FecCD family ABC transporter permease [Ornithinimicrobium cavernae]|uniref:FecCD family ABC transporter permease n=1 Tax=Ornithinimicrobium cavernae TaxID=2666047 RepID=UPI000D6953CD|nr:iron ABC transporter permease [Ornithinimicrobium cavernae]
MTRTRLPTGAVVLLGVAALAVAACLSLAIGSRSLSPGAVLDGLTALVTGEASGSSADGILSARLDRTLIGLVVGLAVALSGAAMQGLTRNPLADPGILGVNSGAALAVVLGLQFAGISTVGGYLWLALLGGLVTAVLVYAVASVSQGDQSLTMVLTGAAVTAGVTSVIAGVLVSNQGALQSFRFWQVGSVAGRDAVIIADVLPLLVVSLLIVGLSGPVLNAAALGEDLERALGQRVHLARFVVAVGAVGLAASAVALAGPIAFVGLVVPHVVRLVTGPDYRRILPGSALVGPVLILLTDTLGRVVTPPSEIQVGIMTAVLGAPVLILLIRRAVLR